MPSFNIVKQWSNPGTYRTEAIRGMFTLEQANLSKHFTGNIPLENETWQIGIIVGRSGTGKTSIAKELYPEAYVSNLQYSEASVLDDFDKSLSVQDITQALSSVGFASPPDWLKSYEQLSQGEKMRVDIARALTMNKDLTVFDEFTSVIDREIAKIACAAISKAIRRSKKKFIAVTCHYDIIDWLEPDWVFCTDTMTFLKKNGSDLQSQSVSTSQALTRGPCLGNFTI